MAFAPLWFRPRCVDTGRRGEHSENTRRSHANRNVRADWVGKTITYDGGQFVLEGKGNIRAADVMEYDRQSQGHSASVSRQGSANMPHAAACISPACRWSRCMLTTRLQARQATAGWVRRKRKSPIWR